MTEPKAAIDPETQAWHDVEKILQEAIDKAREVLRAAGFDDDDIERGLAQNFDDLLEGDD